MKAINLKKSYFFKYKDNLYLIIQINHIKQGRGSATLKIKVRDIFTQTIKTISLNSDAKIELLDLSLKNVIYLYSDDEKFYFMDNKSFQTIEAPKKDHSWESNFLVPELELTLRFYKDRIVDINLPKIVKLQVIEAPDATKGNTVTKPTKEVVVETGLKVFVPIFITNKTFINVSSENGKYVSRS